MPEVSLWLRNKKNKNILELITAYRRVRWKRKPSATTWRYILWSGDALLLLLLAFAPTCMDTFHLSFPYPGERANFWHAHFAWVMVAPVAWGIGNAITRAQELSNVTHRVMGPLSITWSVIFLLAFWMILSSPFAASGEMAYSRDIFLFTLISVFVFCAWRALLATVMNAACFRAQAIIVGTTGAGEMLARELKQVGWSGAHVLGYIRERSEGQERQPEELPVLGGTVTLSRLLQSEAIDMIIMAIDYHSDPALFQEVVVASQKEVTVLPMPVVYERATGKIPVEYVNDQWYMLLPIEYAPALCYLCWRKIVDLLFALVGSIFLALLLPLLALLMRLDSPGPLFYSQERLGYQGRKFRILKFRSMRTDAEQSAGPVWAAVEDARVTRLGRFLRSTHLDELPQVINILRGEMSLIGPRPERQVFVSQLEHAIPFYRCRLRVKPGLTGWAQVMHSYASSKDDALVKLQYDLYYIKHQSFILDMCIILRTALEVFFRHGR